MSSAICFNLDQSKILSSSKKLSNSRRSVFGLQNRQSELFVKKSRYIGYIFMVVYAQFNFFPKDIVLDFPKLSTFRDNKCKCDSREEFCM